MCICNFIIFRFKVHVVYDDSFDTRFGADVDTRITAIFSIVKTLMSHVSLTLEIEPEVIAVTHDSGKTWVADDTSHE